MQGSRFRDWGLVPHSVSPSVCVDLLLARPLGGRLAVQFDHEAIHQVKERVAGDVLLRTPAKVNHSACVCERASISSWRAPSGGGSQ